MLELVEGNVNGIIVVDEYNNDESIEITRGYGAKVY